MDVRKSEVMADIKRQVEAHPDYVILSGEQAQLLLAQIDLAMVEQERAERRFGQP